MALNPLCFSGSGWKPGGLRNRSYQARLVTRPIPWFFRAAWHWLTWRGRPQLGGILKKKLALNPLVNDRPCLRSARDAEPASGATLVSLTDQ